MTLQFESVLTAPRERIWGWITSVDGISAELWPLLRMTVPKGIRSLTDVEVRSGERLFRSYILLFGLIPIDYSDLTLLHLEPLRGFVEQSPMGLMTLWRHERSIREQLSENDGTVVIVDRLAFSSRGAGTLVRWFLRKLFQHRHAVLRARFGHR